MAQLKKKGRWFGMRVTQTIRTENLPRTQSVCFAREMEARGTFIIYTAHNFAKNNSSVSFPECLCSYARPISISSPFFATTLAFPLKQESTYVQPPPPPHPTPPPPPLFYCHGFGRKKLDNNRGGGGRDRIKPIINLL